MKNFQGTEGELWSEFTKHSPHSKNGHITIKVGDVGVPIAILPIPQGSEKQKAKQHANAQLLISSKKLYRELEHVVKALKIATSMGATTPIIERAEAVLKEAITVKSQISVGKYVIVPEPNDTDIHSHSFEGQVIKIREDLAVIEDSEGDCFDIELDRLKLS